ncbi:MAG: hypothetical protein AB7H90_18335 [Alphaproteobacteria bacterium]
MQLAENSVDAITRDDDPIAVDLDPQFVAQRRNPSSDATAVTQQGTEKMPNAANLTVRFSVPRLRVEGNRQAYLLLSITNEQDLINRVRLL